MNFIEDISELTYEKNNIIFQSKKIDELSQDDINELNNFHMQEIFLVYKNDEYFCGIRANHFCIEYGWSENYDDRTIILITANHKAIRMMTMIYVLKNDKNRYK